MDVAPPMSARRALPIALALLWLAACQRDAAPGTSSRAASPAPGAPRAETFASGLNSPWGLAFLPDGSMLVTERNGKLKRVSADGRTVSAPIAGMPTVLTGGTAGLLDVAVANDFAKSRRIFVTFAEPGTGAEAGTNGTSVGTGVLDSAYTAMSDWRVIFRQTPKVESTAHFGSRLVVAPGDILFVTLGERQRPKERIRAQDLSTGHGKVMRIRTDGSVPEDNPFVHTPGAQPAIWSYGHRNTQGAALHPATGELWIHDHGPQGGDEINRILPGRNYGWPLASHGCEYGAPVGACTPVGGATSHPGTEQPLSYWAPTSIAPSGMAFYTGDKFPEWQGNLFIGALAGKALWRLTLEGNTVLSREPLFTNLNERIRDVRQGPDGWLYLLTDNTRGRIVRIVR